MTSTFLEISIILWLQFLITSSLLTEYSDPKDSDPKNFDPKDSDPKDFDPKDFDPRDFDPKDFDPRDSDPKNFDPKDFDPKDSDPNDFWLSNKNEKLLGRSSQFDNLVPLNAQVQATSLQNLAAAEATLNQALTALQSKVSNLVAAAVPNCPTTTPTGSLMVGSYCYFVRTTLDTFVNAQAWCVANGGILAQPLPQNSASFYNLISAVFPNAVAQIGVLGEVWIGLFQKSSSSTAPFTYLSNNVQVPISPTNTAFSILPTSGPGQNAAVLVFPGTVGLWKFYDITALNPAKASICQFTAVL